MTILLRDAEPRDIGFIQSCETRPGYDRFVGHWQEDEHRLRLADPDWHYLVGSEAGSDKGFVILSGMTNRNHNLLLKRIAVHDASSGFGRPFLSAVMGWVFTKTPAERFWLEVVESNPRARHVYRTLGFS